MGSKPDHLHLCRRDPGEILRVVCVLLRMVISGKIQRSGRSSGRSRGGEECMQIFQGSEVVLLEFLEYLQGKLPLRCRSTSERN